MTVQGQPRLLVVFLFLALTVFNPGSGSAQSGNVVSPEPDAEGLIAACVTAFESPLHIEKFTPEDLAILQAGTWADEPMVNLVFVRFPDANESCLTENGELLPDYVGAVMVCKTNSAGVLIPNLVIPQYLIDPYSVPLADPLTGACPATLDDPNWFVPIVWYCVDSGHGIYGSYATEPGYEQLEAEGKKVQRREQGEACTAPVTLTVSAVRANLSNERGDLMNDLR